MNKQSVARDVLEALGGRKNVLSNAVCMTRLRVTLADPQAVSYESLSDVQGVLGTATRGHNGLEIVFGPRVIDSIYHAFIELTGISGGADDLFPMSRQASNMRVQVRTRKKEQAAPPTEQPFIDDSEMRALEDLFGGKADASETPQQRGSWRLLVLNGPNINMLGISPLMSAVLEDYPALLELCKQSAAEAGFGRCDCYQSNHEGDLVDAIQDAYNLYDAILVNPGAYKTSVAVGDALRTVAIPAIEVHLDKQTVRDVVGSACLDLVSGLGAEGYRVAISRLAQHLETDSRL